MLCGDTIIRDQLRISGGAFAHFSCAVERDPQSAHDAVVSLDNDNSLVEAAVLELGKTAPQLALQVFATFAARGDRDEPVKDVIATGWDDKSSELLAQLDADPGDRDLLAVLADHLQTLSDPRGELIALDLANRPERAAQVRRNQVRALLTPALANQMKSRWGIGFIGRLEVPSHALGDSEDLFAHPSLRLLGELRIEAGDTSLRLPARSIPPTIRRLDISRGVLDASVEGITELRRLEQLSLDGSQDIPDELAQPVLRHLTLRRFDGELITPRHLPAVTRLSLRGHDPGLVSHLATTDWLAQLTALDFEDVQIDEHEIPLLAKALRGRKLAELTLHRTGTPARAREALQLLCDQLVFPDGRQVSAAYVVHLNKPEWGRGTVVRRYEDKIDVEFASGTRTFKADAPFLRPSE